MPDAVRVFDKIISEAEMCPLVVFDLDSTLYNVSHRTQLILQNFINDNLKLEEFKNEIFFLKKIKILSTDWGIKDAFARHKFQASQKFYKLVHDYWRKNFFSSDFLHADRPYEGAVEYVNALHDSGLRIFYLTGRDEANMKWGTIESLKKWGFPTYHIETNLLMKPTKGLLEDADYKDKAISTLKKQSTRIWFFENEPVIINRIRLSSPDVQIVWIDTAHSGRSGPPQDLHVIRDIWRTK